MKVLWLTNIPSPYRVDFFNELGTYCDLTVLFECKTSSERDSSWSDFSVKNFKSVILPGIKMGVAEAFCPSVIKYLDRSYDHIVVTNFSDFTGMLAVFLMKMYHLTYEIESDGAFPNYAKTFKSRVKKYLFAGSKRCFSTAKLNDEYYILNGVTQEKLVRYPFSSVSSKDVLLKPLSYEKKLLVRKKLGIKDKYVVLAVGQFIHRKGYDILIRAASQLSNEYGIYILGGTPDEDYITLCRSLNLQNIRFLPFQKKDSLDEYYSAADVFVHPTREDIWGLVINEAMAKGLPVVTTNRCIAGLEMIEENLNGKIVPVENAVLLAEAIIQCTGDGNMPKRALKTALNYTIEEMAKKHMNIWENEKTGDIVNEVNKVK